MPLETDYVALADLKAWLRIGDTTDDAELALAITTASRDIDQFANRRFGRDDVATTRWYTATAAGPVEVHDIATTGGLAVTFDGTTVTLDGEYRLAPYNAAADGEPYTRLELVNGSRFPTTARGVAVTAVFGWPAIPDAVRFATRVQAGTLLKGGRDSPLGVAGSPEFGNELRLSTGLHAMAQRAVRPYRRVWGVA